MTDDDQAGKDVPEFVAVTPPVPEPAAAQDADDTTAPDAPGHEQPAATDGGPADDQPAQPSPEPPQTPEPGREATADRPMAPERVERPSLPSLETAGLPANPHAGPEPRLPEPGRTGSEPTEPGRDPADETEVSVRVAAEGMAAALSGNVPLPDEAGTDERPRALGSLAIATAVCVVLALAAGVLLAITAHSNSHHRAIAAARVAALQAAKQETAVALTYDYRSLDADFQRAEAGMSRKFRANYAQTAASSVAPLAAKTHAITTGTVAAGGVVSATEDTARVLVFANQTVENKLLNATSRLDRSVIEVTMVKENGRWVIDNLQPF
jgi:hypothetical protein